MQKMSVKAKLAERFFFYYYYFKEEKNQFCCMSVRVVETGERENCEMLSGNGMLLGGSFWHSATTSWTLSTPERTDCEKKEKTTSSSSSSFLFFKKREGEIYLYTWI